MMGTETLKYSLKNLYARKSRSFLTVLSIFIGITTIFIFVSFGLGLYSYINTMASESGIDKFMVTAKGLSAPGMDNVFKLEEKDLKAIEKINGVKLTLPMSYRVVKVEKDRKTTYTFGIAYPVDSENNRMLREFTTAKILKGRELKSGEKGKVVVGYNYLLSKKIFEKPYSLGEKILINDQKFEIVCFYGSIGNPQDDAQIYMDYKDFENLFNEQNMPYSYIITQVQDPTQLNQIAERAKKELRKVRDKKEGKEDFYVQTFEQAIEQFSAALNIVIGFILMIALVSVVVSAVNTTNTMVTSVLERTKEIGVMKAIGAKKSIIRNIFLFESSILGLIAGILGVTFGYLLASLGGSILASLGWSFLAPKFTWMLFVSLILFATIIGTLSGVTVAISAARQNAVDALRYE
jgi:putative ABC transport system permease protein